jgi:tetratricopeptide (TPR) repeat protein
VPKDKSKPTPDSFELVFAAAQTYRPPPELLAKSEAIRKESDRCFSRAIELAPKEPDVFLGRAAIRGTLNIADLLARYYRDRQPVDQKLALKTYCTPDAVLDLKRAVELCPDDFRMIAATAWIEWSYTLANLERQPSGGHPAWDELPDATKRGLHEALGKLETLSHAPDKTQSAGALENLGTLKLVMNDAQGAKTALRSAVVLEPARENAWGSLLVAAVSSGATPAELVNISESLIKCNNSARNHLVLAKALVKANRLDDAKKEIQTAEDMEPRNVLTRLFGVALSLKLSDDERYLAYANTQVRWLDDIFEKMSDGQEKQMRLREYLLDTAIFNGLVDKPDQAKECVNRVLKVFPDDETAKDIRSAIQ